MARIRTIKPDFWRNPDLSEVSPEAALLAIGLLNVADDEGYFLLNEKLIEADIFPMRELSRSTTVVLRELYDIGYLEVFSTPENRLYGHVVNFAKHQVINNKTASKIKSLDLLPYDYRSPTVVLPSGKERKGKEKEGEREKETRQVAASKNSATLKPDSVSKQVWEDWLAHRKEKKAVVTKTVIEKIQAESVKAGISVSEAMELMCLRGWVGINAQWIEEDVKKQKVVSFAGDKSRLNADQAKQAIFGNGKVIDHDQVGL